MRVVVAPQEFKGSLSAGEAAEVLAAGVRQALPSAIVDVVPMADGGPGTVEAVAAAGGGALQYSLVEDPLGRPVEAQWAVLAGGTAVIEMAQAAGLWRLRPEERDPRVASTYGVGQLLKAALAVGCQRLIVGLGGSATNDGGAGMAQALGARFLDERDQPLRCGGADLIRLQRIDVSALDQRLAQCAVIAAADVLNPLCGPEGASLVYAFQKGATASVAEELEAALRRYGEVIERDLGVSVLDAAGAGAAGGLGAGLIAFLRAQLRPGFEVVAELVGLEERLRGADLVLTGEGRLDAQTAYGKTVAGVARLAARCGVPAIAVVGSLGEGWHRVLALGLEGVEAVRGALNEQDAMQRAPELVVEAAARALRGWLRVEAIKREV